MIKEMKDSLEQFNSKSELTKEKFRELEDNFMERKHSDEQRKKEQRG